MDKEGGSRQEQRVNELRLSYRETVTLSTGCFVINTAPETRAIGVARPHSQLPSRPTTFQQYLSCSFTGLTNFISQRDKAGVPS
ncbi:hypothetical protein J6590_003970 [Homalodisca vitripennis]|nr:hypothetical protein J6590_003970 [Homalodisca vitripennis]